LIGVRAYDDSDPLDAELAQKGIEMIAPHPTNRKKPKTQESRKLRRYKRRWKIERLFTSGSRTSGAFGGTLRMEGRELPQLREGGVSRHLAEVFMR
jgi:hypothetical protein